MTWTHWSGAYNEVLLFTPNNTIVVREKGKMPSDVAALFGVVGIFAEAAVAAIRSRKEKGEREKPTEISVEDILKADKNNYVIPNSDVTEVELKIPIEHLRKGHGLSFLRILTNKKCARATRWYGKKYGKEGEARARECEKLLRSVFGDKLSVVEHV